MSKIVEVKKAPAVVKGAVLEFNKEELDYLMTALEVGYKAHKGSGFSVYVAPTARDLWLTLDAARKGNSSAVTASSDIYARRPF